MQAVSSLIVLPLLRRDGGGETLEGFSEGHARRFDSGRITTQLTKRSAASIALFTV